MTKEALEMFAVPLIHRTYHDTEVHALAVAVKCPHCGAEWNEIDLTEPGVTYNLICEDEDCGKDFRMYFDVD